MSKASSPDGGPNLVTRSFHEISEWLRAVVAERLHIDGGTIDLKAPLRRYGLDSLELTSIAGELEEWLGFELPATIVSQYPTIDSLSRYLTEASHAAAKGAPPHEH